MIRLAALCVLLSGCGAPAIPLLTAVGGAAAGAARLDIAVLDTIEAAEGREAKAVGVCAMPATH